MSCKEIHIQLSNTGEEKQVFTLGEAVPSVAGGDVEVNWQGATRSNDSSNTWFFIQELFPEKTVEVENFTIEARYDSDTVGVDDRWTAGIYSFEGETLADRTFAEANLTLLAESHETEAIPAGDFTFTFDPTRLEKGGSYCTVIRGMLVEPLNDFYKNTGKTQVDLQLYIEQPFEGKLIQTVSTGFYEKVYPEGKSWLKSLGYTEISSGTRPSLEVSENYEPFRQRLETKTFWINKIRITGFDRAVFEKQVLNVLRHITKAEDGREDRWHMAFRRTSNDNHPVAELVFETPVPLGFIHFLEMRLEAGFKGTLSLCLSEEKRKEHEPDQWFNRIELKIGCPCRVPLVVGIVSLLAATYMKNKK